MDHGVVLQMAFIFVLIQGFVDSAHTTFRGGSIAELGGLPRRVLARRNLGRLSLKLRLGLPRSTRS